jgi:carboxyl-terminal processing protease
VTDEMLSRFNNYFNTRSRYKITFVAYADEVKLYIKAKMAEQLFGDEAYRQILNSNDDMLVRVNELIQE